MLHQVNQAQLAEALEAAKQAGAKTATIKTGSVTNDDLAAKLRWRAQTGTTLAGGVVTELPQTGAFPQFEITYSEIP